MLLFQHQNKVGNTTICKLQCSGVFHASGSLHHSPFFSPSHSQAEFRDANVQRFARRSFKGRWPRPSSSRGSGTALWQAWILDPRAMCQWLNLPIQGVGQHRFGFASAQYALGWRQESHGCVCEVPGFVDFKDLNENPRAATPSPLKRRELSSSRPRKCSDPIRMFEQRITPLRIDSEGFGGFCIDLQEYAAQVTHGWPSQGKDFAFFHFHWRMNSWNGIYAQVMGELFG